MTIQGVIDVIIPFIVILVLDYSMSLRNTIRRNIFGLSFLTSYIKQEKLHQPHTLVRNYSNMAGSNITFTVGMEPYCYKQFDSKNDNYIPCSKEEFLQELREKMQRNEARLTDGYAPFCKHLFVENFTDAQPGSMEITEENKHLLRSGYVARTEKELPVLSRWFVKKDVAHTLSKAKFLDVILYSREQVIKENLATGVHQDVDSYEFDYYVISIKPQDTDQEIPMAPITMFRNTMIEEGGSGVPIDHKLYMKSVNYWKNNAMIKGKD